MQLSEDQILTLAPDEASKKAGRELAAPGKWVTRGVNELALWGECQGSGSKPYQTQVDLSAIAFKCSCPSRKFPCKHGLGLLLLQSRQPGLFAKGEMPPWVADWINKRGEKETKKVEKAEKPLDEAAQVKRQQAREQKVTDGIAELLVWLKDIVRGGILTMPEKNAAYWDNMARRMVDAQANGLAGMVRNLASTNFWKEGWQTEFMDRVVQLYLVAQSYQHLPGLPEELQQDVRTAIGFNTNLDELKQQTGVTDTWLVLGKDSREEQQLTIERNWLYGIKTGQNALILQFMVKGQLGQLSLTPGMYIQAELVFFPSAVPFRAIIKTQNVAPVVSRSEIKKFSGWREVAEQETDWNSRLPFGSEIPVVVSALKPVQYQQRWWLQDVEGSMSRIPAGFDEIWQLMALSGGESLDMAVIGKENEYKPLGIWHQDNYKSI